MARRCELTGKDAQFGHNVSHSNRKTNRRFDPNLQKITFYSEALRRRIRLRVCTRALRTVQKHGGLDPFLVKMSEAQLGVEGQRLQRLVKKAMRGKPRPQAPQV